jgi:hypothetical protein
VACSIKGNKALVEIIFAWPFFMRIIKFDEVTKP